MRGGDDDNHDASVQMGVGGVGGGGGVTLTMPQSGNRRQGGDGIALMMHYP